MKYFQAVKERVAGFLLDEEAASAIEYAVVAGVIVAILLVAMQDFFGTLDTTFGSIAEGIAEIAGGGDGG